MAMAGALAGLLSGLFGVGGGIVMVPLFALWLGLDHKRASATSLIAIIPIAGLAVVGYATGGSVDWVVGLALGLGSIVGGQLGVRALPYIPIKVLQIGFAALLVYSAYGLVFPSDNGSISHQGGGQPWLLLIVVGVIAGALAGLLGVGGGVILVPALVLLAGSNMDVARGTSLMVVLFTAVTASVTNIRAERADVKVGVVAGLIGAPVALLASYLGQWLPERQASILFALLMLYAAAQLVLKALKKAPVDGTPAALPGGE
jgi:uncharacterized membrane protein YfcA